MLVKEERKEKMELMDLQVLKEKRESLDCPEWTVGSEKKVLLVTLDTLVVQVLKEILDRKEPLV